jgi:hypothetical protein
MGLLLSDYLVRRKEEQGGAMDVADATPSLEETVASAEAGLAEAQIALEVTRVDLDRLTRMHHHHLGPLYDRLDQLDLLIAEARAAAGDAEAARRAYALRYGSDAPVPFDPLTDPLAEPEPQQPQIDPDYASTLRFTESAEPAKADDPAKAVQRLYRDLARRVHPDLAQDPVEKERRNAFIARVNDAYKRGDLYELQRLAEEWAVISANGPEVGTPERGLWLRQRLIWLRARVAEARVEQETLLSSPLGQVLAEFGPARALDVLYARLWETIQLKEQELNLIYATPDAGTGHGMAIGVAQPLNGSNGHAHQLLDEHQYQMHQPQYQYPYDPESQESYPTQGYQTQLQQIQFSQPAQPQPVEQPGQGFFG